MQTTVIAIICQKINAENDCTLSIVSNLCANFGIETEVYMKLSILSQQSKHYFTKINAAGCFNVDFTMLFLFINLLISYVIIILQLK